MGILISVAAMPQTTREHNQADDITEIMTKMFQEASRDKLAKEGNSRFRFGIFSGNLQWGIASPSRTCEQIGSQQCPSETLHVIQKSGRHDWTRTSDLFRVKEAL